MAKKKSVTNTKKAKKVTTKKASAAKTIRAAGKTQISISMSADLVAKIDKLAAAENRNRSNFISTALERL